MEKYESSKISVPYTKIEGYLLNPSKPHSQEFFDVGYLPGEGDRLFHDIEDLFDKSKAMKYRITKKGFVEYVIFMYLGIDKKRTFRTVWREDDKAQLPRFITAYRDKEGEKYV